MLVTEATATNIINDAENGNRVAVIVPDLVAAKDAMQTIVAAIDEATAYQVARTGQRIRINGFGLISFHDARQPSNLQDVIAERIYIDETSAQDEKIMAAARACLELTSGELLRYAS